MKSLERQLVEAHDTIKTLEKEIRDLDAKRARVANHHISEVNLIESFMRAGLSKEEAEIAAAGRQQA